MGGYGGASGKTKDKCYRYTGGNKVKDKNAITVAEHYIAEGKYVAFLQEKQGQPRADLSVEGQHVEVKGLSSMNPDNIEGKIKHAFEQIHGDDYRYPPETYREGKVVILSKHSKDFSESEVYSAIQKGFISAEHKGYVTGKLELWINGKIHKLN